VRSELELDLVEATLKKTTFLQHMLKRLDLLKVGVFHARAEELGQDAAFRGEYDVVLARAVAKLPTLAEYCLPFCKIGGRFIAQKGSSAPEELETAQEAIEILGGQVREAKELRIAEMAQHRYLIVIEKVAPTPAKYPRRPGMPAKRPL
jgi:16S rRNA (guanine527-N7)-methyltransferase